MKTITFIDADGQAQEVTVTDKVFATVEELEKKDYSNERKHRRKRISLEKALDNGWDVADPSIDIEADYERKERYNELYKALDTLTKKQRELVDKIFFKGMTQVEVAKEENVSNVAINLRLQVILKKLRKYFGILT